MSDITRDNVVRAALMTRKEAEGLDPREPDPWMKQFIAAFDKHLEDEAMRFLAVNGCTAFLRTGDPCPGPWSKDVGCDNCEATKWVEKADAEEAKIVNEWKAYN